MGKDKNFGDKCESFDSTKSGCPDFDAEPAYRPQSAQDQQNEILEDAYFEKIFASKRETHFDLKNFNPEAESSVIPLAKFNQPSVRPDDLELKAFQDAEQIIRELGVIEQSNPMQPAIDGLEEQIRVWGEEARSQGRSS